MTFRIISTFQFQKCLNFLCKRKLLNKNKQNSSKFTEKNRNLILETSLMKFQKRTLTLFLKNLKMKRLFLLKFMQKKLTMRF